ncbi:MAG: GGDEF domain-containing protein [Anaerolineaceae bacterium]|nr:GGDEF domain-containing protein [Anaerolineaceae bacterium]
MLNARPMNGIRGMIHSKFADLNEALSKTENHTKNQINAKEAEPVNKTGSPNRKPAANKMIIPVIIVLAVLHVVIIGLIIAINQTSSVLASIQRNAGTYSQDVSTFMSGASQLSETSSTFIMMPLNDSGEFNAMPLGVYTQEFIQDHRGDDLLERFRTYDVSAPVVGLLSEAADSANFMLNNQLHAIALIASAYSLPKVGPLEQLPLPELTAEELAMPKAAKEGMARMMVFGSDYSLNKRNVAEKVSQAVGIIQGTSAEKTAEASVRIEKLRASLWVVTASVIVILIITFTMLYRWILNPLGKFAKQIPTGDFLDETEGFSEVTLIASAYNDVLKRRNALDTILRNAAETDALTNLPNRYSFEQYLLESSDKNIPMAVFLFDVNFLKKTNDTQGHLAGDKLLCNAAECISDCFGDKCFRFGGDEFAAIVDNCTPGALQQMTQKFERMEAERNVSISYGYAYTDLLGKTSVKALLDEADRKMYEQKRQTHNERQE